MEDMKALIEKVKQGVSKVKETNIEQVHSSK
jgi:hypothetical protein